ncbi:hypothetical protein ACWF94_40930, partial [Streptomyces sp. NPDC055078]
GLGSFQDVRVAHVGPAISSGLFQSWSGQWTKGAGVVPGAEAGRVPGAGAAGLSAEAGAAPFARSGAAGWGLSAGFFPGVTVAAAA